MEYKFKLQGLDCANCANKIEQKVAKLKQVDEAVVNFNTATLMASSSLSQEELMNKIETIVHQLEPDVVVKILNKENVQHDHHHEEKEICGCGHDHHHEEKEACGCGHDHHHEEKEVCGCGHDHHHEEQETCACGHDHGAELEQPYIELAGALVFKIENLDCASCAMKVENQMNQLPFVEKAVVNFSTSKVQIKLHGAMEQEEVKNALQKLVDQIEPGVKIYSQQEADKPVKTKIFDMKENLPFLLGTAFVIASFFLPEGTWELIVLGIAYLLIGGKVIWKALKNIKAGEVFDENFLMTIATVGAFLTGEYLEAVAVMFLYYIGEIFQAYAVNRSRKSIGALMDIRSDYANILIDGKEMKLSPEDVQIGSTMIVRPGERVAMDGIVLEGESSLDTSALTGESMPRHIAVGEELLSGVINMSGVLKVKVTKSAGESTVSRILELVENATNKKAPIEKFITKFAKVYTPIVCALAVAVAIVPPLLSGGEAFDMWIYRALTFLVVSCPCALVISIPLALFAGIGGASKQGVLIKGGNDLERIKDLDVLVVDKTGTLTKGKFSVVEMVSDDQERLLELSAYGEFYSHHPIAKSIVARYGKDIDASQIENYEEIAGHGIKALVKGKEILLGNVKLMQANQIDVKPVKKIGTIIHVAYDHHYLGYLVIADEIKESTYEGIKQLKALGLKRIVMLTGDDESVAKDVADKLGIHEYYANLLPQDKVTKVEELLNQPHVQLGFVGDGINDAPVLARSDIGIAMGGIGSDVAIEAADVVLMNDDFTTLATAITVSKRTNRILKQNIYFSLGVKAVVLVLAAVGIADMWLGVFADVGVTCLAILNSMRALKK
ncbi:heavy metal translocating P-type ATPase [Beduini massiliensis]|uniref:heavy metal translocating P-type ATPase n=1 Tax=Beduini massiliensis TaxID=1585974 RepID=UPI00059A7EEF|nr:heavy metal translocating P-type ATPase [Beduini massiliensis]